MVCVWAGSLTPASVWYTSIGLERPLSVLMILGRSLGNRFSQGLCYSWAISGDAPFEFFPGPGPLPRNVENL
jgi:hypothetical protein